MRKQTKYYCNKLAVYTPTKKSLRAATRAAQNMSELVRLGKVTEVQKPSLYFMLLPDITHSVSNG